MSLISVVSRCKDNILCNYKQKHNKYFAEDAFDFSKCQLKIYSNPDKSTHHKTKPDTPCHPSKYSIFSRYLWTGLFPQPFNFNDL